MNIKKIFTRSPSSGTILVETALVIPILIGITFFIIEFGSVLYLSNSLNQIARAAARYAAVTPTYTISELIDVSGARSSLPDISKLTLNITPAPGATRSVGATITVNVEYSYTPIINPFGLFNSNTLWAPRVRSSSSIRSEVSNA